MLKLRKSDRQQQAVSPVRLLEADQRRTEKMLKRGAELDRSRVRQVMSDLQQRFSYTGDLPKDIAEIVEAQVKHRTRDLFRQANYDALTHLPNRSYFGEILEEVIETAEQKSGSFSLLFLDLDGFKAVNDRLGHHAGDELLQNVGARLIASVREGDVVGRRGGDEFVILLPELSERQAVVKICQRIINEVGRAYWLDQKEACVSTSIGVARYPQDGKTPAELMEHSDSALYVSKSSGKQTYHFYNEVKEGREIASISIQKRLGEAIVNGEIQACFEPQMDLKSGRIVGAGMTAKWDNSSLKNPYLSGWSDQLPGSGQLGSVASWLVDSALHYLQQWQSVDSDCVISVPVLEGLWHRERLLSWLDERVHSYGVDRDQLQLEFSLASLQRGGESLKQVLLELAEAGYPITLTDVGAYPLDLTLLSGLRIGEVKLDRAWLQNSMVSEKGRTWLKALIATAKTLDICVIASGVETVQQARTLQSWGCLMGQGPAWSQPIEATRFHTHLMARHRVGK